VPSCIPRLHSSVARGRPTRTRQELPDLRPTRLASGAPKGRNLPPELPPGHIQVFQRLFRAGFTEAYLEERFVKFRQGCKSMSPALRQLEVEILEGRLAHGDNPILEWNARSAVVVRDTADNRKLVKLDVEDRRSHCPDHGDRRDAVRGKRARICHVYVFG